MKTLKVGSLSFEGTIVLLILFSKLLEGTFTNKWASFSKKYSVKNIRLAVFARDSPSLLRAPVRANFSFAPKLTTQLLSCCNAFWGNIYPLTMPGPPGELMKREKISFKE